MEDWERGGTQELAVVVDEVRRWEKECREE